MKELLRRAFRSQAAPIIVVFLSLSLVVWWSWRSAISVREADKQASRNERIVDISDSVKDRLKNYEEILLGSSGLINAGGSINPDQWATYFNSTNVKENYPGTLGFGYIELVKPENLPGFLQQTSAHRWPGFRIYPEGSRELYAAIVLLEPQTDENKAAIGFDMYSEDMRRSAMDEAAESGRSVITGSMKLVQDNADEQHAGFLMFTPIYRSDASNQKGIENVRGFAYIPFRAEDFFKRLEPEINPEGVAVEIIDQNGQTPTTLYVGSTFETMSKQTKTSTTQVPVKLYGTDWQIKFLFDEFALVSSSEDSRPVFIAAAGAFAAVLLTVMVWLLLRARNYDLTAQKEHEVNRAKDSLLSIASHQLRTPATGVKQYLGIVLQGFTGDITPSQRSMLEKAYSSNERQLRIINEVLHLARLESGRIVLAKSKVDLSKLIQDIVLELASEVVEHEHKLRTFGIKKPVYIHADEHMLRMAIENLITNAIKYTPNGGKIRVRLKVSRRFVDIEVQDNGIGVAAEDRASLYKQFVRLHNPLTRQVSGTGIGLYLAKQLVELHHGKISLVSKSGKGSTFTITIPKHSVKNLTESF